MELGACKVSADCPQNYFCAQDMCVPCPLVCIFNGIFLLSEVCRHLCPDFDPRDYTLPTLQPSVLNATDAYTRPTTTASSVVKIVDNIVKIVDNNAECLSWIWIVFYTVLVLSVGVALGYLGRYVSESKRKRKHVPKDHTRKSEISNKTKPEDETLLNNGDASPDNSTSSAGPENVYNTIPDTNEPNHVSSLARSESQSSFHMHHKGEGSKALQADTCTDDQYQRHIQASKNTIGKCKCRTTVFGSQDIEQPKDPNHYGHEDIETSSDETSELQPLSDADAHEQRQIEAAKNTIGQCKCRTTLVGSQEIKQPKDANHYGHEDLEASSDN